MTLHPFRAHAKVSVSKTLHSFGKEVRGNERGTGEQRDISTLQMQTVAFVDATGVLGRNRGRKESGWARHGSLTQSNAERHH